MAAIPFVIINTFEGVRDVPKDLSDMARAYEAPRMRTVRHVMLPSLMPFFFASLRYGLANGWKAVVLAEVFASTSGAGWNIQFWRDAHRAQGVFGYALFFIIFALFWSDWSSSGWPSGCSAGGRRSTPAPSRWR